MFEDTYAPPVYLDLYNFKDGAQDDIFLDSYAYIPTPSPSQGEVPTPINQSVPQPSLTGAAKRNSARTVREPSALSSSFKALFFIVALCISGVF